MDPRFERGIRRLSISLLFVVQGGAAAQQAVTGASVQCAQNAILVAERGAATLVLCPSIARAVPELKPQLDRLETLLAARDEDTRRELAQLRSAVNTLSRQLRTADAEQLARTLATRLATSAGASESRVFNDLARLRVDLREVNEKIEALRSAPATSSRTEAELKGAAGTALARMDFAQANAMLDGLARVESKVDAMARDVRDLVNPADAAVLVASDRRMAEDAWRRFLAAGGDRRCPILHSELLRVLDASLEAEKGKRFLAARGLLMTVLGRANQATSELSSSDRLEETRRATYEHLRASGEHQLRELERDIQVRQSAIDEQSRERQRERDERIQSTSHELRRTDAEVQELSTRIAQLRAELEAARAQPAVGESESYRKMVLVRQLEQGLEVVEIRLREAVERKQRSAEALSDVGEADSRRVDVSDSLRVEVLHIVSARDRIRSALVRSAELAASGKRDAAMEVIQAAEHEVRSLRYGQEPPPLQRPVGARATVALQACR